MTKKSFIQINISLSLLIVLSFFSIGCSKVSIEQDQTRETLEVVTDSSSEIDSEEAIDTYEAVLKTNLKAWGLGNSLIFYVGNNRTYDWYLDQAHTGDHSNNNCGPTTVTMAAKWANASFDGTPEDARDAFRPNGGWWYSDDIDACLERFDIDYDTIMIEDAYTLRAIIDSGRIAIINNSMGYITRESDTNFHKNRFYEFDSGHYFIIKGYALVDQYTYFEVYDPNNWDMTYADGTPMGKDRYYEASVLMASIDNWYPYAIAINRSK